MPAKWTPSKDQFPSDSVRHPLLGVVPKPIRENHVSGPYLADVFEAVWIRHEDTLSNTEGVRKVHVGFIDLFGDGCVDDRDVLLMTRF